MLGKQVLGLRASLRNDGVLFFYSGYVTELLLEALGVGLREKLAIDGVSRKQAMSLFSLFVEQMQNIVRYSAEVDGDAESGMLRYGVLAVGRDGSDGYFISCGNMVKRSEAERLKSALDAAKGMTHEELMVAYKRNLKGEVPEFSKGANVGILDMARLATRGFDYTFTDQDDSLAFFTLTTRL